VDQHTTQQIAVGSALIFWCGSHSAPSGSWKWCLHLFKWHSCLTHMQLLQGVPTPASTQCGVFITISYIWKWWPFSHKSQTFALSGNVAWHPRRWLTWICSWYQGGHVCWTAAVLFSLRPFVCRGAGKSLAFPICSTTKIIFLGWVKEVRTTKS
jgi:hypothetical protein